jgi:hypothetical protein
VGVFLLCSCMYMLVFILWVFIWFGSILFVCLYVCIFKYICVFVWVLYCVSVCTGGFSNVLFHVSAGYAIYGCVYVWVF